MSSIYIPFDFNLNDIITIPEIEFKHLKVLRKTSGNIKITNGLGKFAFANIIKNNKNQIDIKILDIFENHNENNFTSTLFFGIIDDKSRIEFIIEKTTELGINNIYPVFFKNSQFKKFDLERNIKKSISAIKQSERSKLPNISNVILFEEMLQKLNDFDFNFLADYNGEKTINNNINNKNVSLIVGPEGGITNNEIELLNEKILKVKLSEAVLRTETASISLITKIL